MEKEKVYRLLQEMEIDFKLVDHPPAMTTEEADQHILDHQGVRTKTLFLRDRKKKQYFLLIVDGSKTVCLKALGELLGVKGLGFCSEESLWQKMKLPSGAVGIFGLMHNDERDIQVLLDEDLSKEEIFTFHPNENTATLFLTRIDMERFLEKVGYEMITKEIPGEETKK